jgi:solute carrier family 25 carnitine/acylcarnitine transporter 20/29
MMQITAYIWEREGPQGFFSGVKSMMIGQAIVKAMAFSTNAYMIDFLQVNPLTHNLPHSATLLMAACMAGFVASFVVTPVERVSVLMQAQQTNKYASEMDCFLSVLRKEGPGDLFTRGLGATLCREVPSDGIYFWLYGLLMASPYVGLVPAALAPLLFGGFAGMASWLPIYPVDQVKTIIQNTDDEQAENKSIWSVTQQLYRDGGVAAFYDGLDAKLLRAFVHHAFTFGTFFQFVRQQFCLESRHTSGPCLLVC